MNSSERSRFVGFFSAFGVGRALRARLASGGSTGRSSRARSARPTLRLRRLTLLFVFPVLACLARAASTHAPRPNILFIMADDLGYADLGCFGQTKIRTPNIDRLATQGTRFTDVYAGAPVCAPSRCVLMTGLHTGHGRIRGNSPKVGGEIEEFGEGGRRLSLTNDDRTVAEALHDAGYVTGAIGKWGLGEPGTAGTPNRRGFDEWYGYLNQNHAPYYYTDYLWRNDRKEPIPENSGGKRGRYSHDLLTDEAVAFLRRNGRKPFFLYLPFTIPHKRFEVPSLESYANESWPEEAKIYAAMVTRLDRDVGRVLAELEQLGLAKNTVVFFTSDNGADKKSFGNLFQSYGPLRDAKGSVYDGGIRVPMIVRWPGVTPAGRVSGVPWGFVDIFPTFLALAGGSGAGKTLDGRNLLPILRGEEQPVLAGRHLYWEDPGKQFRQAVRRGNWKVVRTGKHAPLALYDLSKDPGESRNVASIHPAVVADFERFLATARVPSPHWPDEN
ncbi:MAG: sulfatase [Opitutus sp.]|nr:sulfatase [Opitutus sp.]